MMFVKQFKSILPLVVMVFFFNEMATAQTSWLDHYFTPPNGWKVNEHVRTTGDVNGDGKADLVGFGNAGVFVSFSNGSGFSKPEMLVGNYAIGAGNWDVNKNPRCMGDVNGDGKDDIIGYGNAGVYVSLSTGNGFTAPSIYLEHYFTAANGWQPTEHIRTVGDINGDGKTDLVGFGNAGVFVSFSTGSGFSKPEMLVGNYAVGAGGWSVSAHARVVADVNGDGKDDIIGYGNAGVYVSLSTGTSFTAPSMYLDHYFTAGNGGWNNQLHVRTAGDVNGDGKADLIGFGDAGVFVSLAQRNGFAEPKMRVNNFAQNAGGWRVNNNVRVIADINGDGREDVVGFGNGAVLVSTNMADVRTQAQRN